MSKKVLAIVKVVGSKYDSSSVCNITDDTELDNTYMNLGKDAVDVDVVKHSVDVPAHITVYQYNSELRVAVCMDQESKLAKSERNYFPVLLTLLTFKENVMIGSKSMEVYSTKELVALLRINVPMHVVNTRIELSDFDCNAEMVIANQDDRTILSIVQAIPKEEGFEYDTKESIAAERAEELAELRNAARAAAKRMRKALFGMNSDDLKSMRGTMNPDDMLAELKAAINGDDHDCTKCTEVDCPNHPEYKEEDDDIDKRNIN
jgi:hypothetical protein